MAIRHQRDEYSRGLVRIYLIIMAAQYIQLPGKTWNILVYYNVSRYDFVEVEDSLRQIDCPKEDIRKAFKVLRNKNTGFTFSNTDYKMSIVCIGKATNTSQFVSTVIHESKHVQSHICRYYGVSERSEDAAYLIGYIVRMMYKMLVKLIKAYV